MKKYVILVGIVALMSSCNEDIYDNIKEMVDTEKVYPAGYDQNLGHRVGLAGFERVEIELCGAGNRNDSTLFMPRAAKTVVEYDDTTVVFTPARSWVNITGLALPQTYNFTIYTEDESGNKSVPVTASGKPFTESDKGSLQIFGLSYTANTTQAVVIWNPAPSLYTVIGVEYSYTDLSGAQSGNVKGDRLVFNGLPAGVSTSVDLSFTVLPAGAIDTIPLPDYNIKITTMTAAEWDDYFNLSRPFPLADTILTSAAPLIIKAADFDLGGEGYAYHMVTRNGEGNMTYRQNGGDENYDYGVFDGTCLGWADVGDWSAYTVYVQDPGVYKIECNKMMPFNGGQASLTLDGLDILGIIPITNNGWAWEWIDPHASVQLSAGKHKFRWTHLGAGHYFGGLRLTFVRP